jgi:hypothetical protein
MPPPVDARRGPGKGWVVIEPICRVSPANNPVGMRWVDYGSVNRLRVS